MEFIENCKYRWSKSTCPYNDNCEEYCVRIHMTNEPLLMFEHGSTVYGTNNEKSDIDIVVVVPDKYSDFLDKYPNSIYQFNPEQSFKDFEFLTESTYIKLIKNLDIMAIESLFLPSKNIIQGNPSKYIEYFYGTDLWKIRQSFSGKASNSWAKAHKKMTVEKDFDLYCAQKSLFHSLRILDFANQLCEHDKIVDYSSVNKYWKEIMEMNGADWEEYKTKFKPVYNSLRSKLAELAPKPVEN